MDNKNVLFRCGVIIKLNVDMTDYQENKNMALHVKKVADPWFKVLLFMLLKCFKDITNTFHYYYFLNSPFVVVTYIC